MKKLFLSLLLAYSGFTFASNNNDDCQYITGHWRGVFTFADKEDCVRYSGCQHQAEATVEDVHVMYSIKLNSDTDVKGLFSVYCQEGKLFTPGNPLPSERFTFKCYGKNDCHASYDGNRLKIDLYKVSA